MSSRLYVMILFLNIEFKYVYMSSYSFPSSPSELDSCHENEEVPI